MYDLKLKSNSKFYLFSIVINMKILYILKWILKNFMQDPQWVGAWWVGIFVGSMLCFVCSVKDEH